MEIIGGVGKKDQEIKGQNSRHAFTNDCLCFEQIINLILSGEVMNARAPETGLSHTENTLSGKKEASGAENILRTKHPIYVQAIEDSVQIIEQDLQVIDKDIQISEEDAKTIEKGVQVVERSLVSNKPKGDLTDAGEELRYPILFKSGSVEHIQSSTGKFSKVLYDGNLRDNTPKIENGMQKGPEDSGLEFFHSDGHEEKRGKQLNVHTLELTSYNFEENLKPTQEVKEVKQRYNAQEHKVFYIKLEDGDLKIRFVKDSLSVSLNLREDFRSPSPYESYKLMESLSQIGLRLEYFSINGKNLQWEFKQGHEGRKESRFKSVSLNSEDERKNFSFYL
ncbi:hypothetical protein [Thermocrinis sp.]